jgi:hypothetical protein
LKETQARIRHATSTDQMLSELNKVDPAVLSQFQEVLLKELKKRGKKNARSR